MKASDLKDQKFAASLGPDPGGYPVAANENCDWCRGDGWVYDPWEGVDDICPCRYYAEGRLSLVETGGLSLVAKHDEET